VAFALPAAHMYPAEHGPAEDNGRNGMRKSQRKLDMLEHQNRMARFAQVRPIGPPSTVQRHTER
jgi:hypothetical protein